MKHLTFYKIDTGEVTKTLLCPAGHTPQVPAGEALIEGNYPDDKFRIVDGHPMERGVVSVSGEEQPSPITGDHVRLIRDQLLVSSDYTQLDDAPHDKAAWAAYRQQLRDLPEQTGFPENVVWPETPPTAGA